MEHRKWSWLAVGAGVALVVSAMAWVGQGMGTQASAKASPMATTPGGTPQAIAALPADEHVQFGEWRFEGPRNVAGAAVAITLDEINGDLYTVSRDNWIYRSTDHGKTWTAVHRFDSPRPIKRMVIERGATSVYAFYAITEPVDVYNGVTQHSLLRLRASTGATQVLLPTYDVRDVVVGPQGVYALTDETRSDFLSSVRRTSDGGQTWTVLLDEQGTGRYAECSRLERAGTRVLAGCFVRDYNYRYNAAVYVSESGGSFLPRWQNTFAESGEMSFDHQFAVSRSDPSVVYMSIDRYGKGGAYIFRSTDGGVTFEKRADPTAGHVFNAALAGRFDLACTNSYQFSAMPTVLAVDPVDPQVVWTGEVDLYRSDDGGATFGRAWTDPDANLADYRLRKPHGIVFPLNYDGMDAREMLVATDFGIQGALDARAAVQTAPPTTCVTPGPASAVAWVARNDGFDSVHVASAHVRDDGQVLAVFGPDNAGQNVAGNGLFHGELAVPAEWLQLSAAQPKVVLAEARSPEVFYTSACGAGRFCRWEWEAEMGRWEVVASQASVVQADGGVMVPDPSDPTRFWAAHAATQPLLRSSDAMQTWQEAGYLTSGYPKLMAISPGNPDHAVVVSDMNTIHRRTDARSTGAGTRWEMAYHVAPWESPWRARSVVYDKRDPKRVYVTGTAEPSVLASRDGGATWQLADALGEVDGLPGRDTAGIAIHPDNSDVLVAGTSNGVYVTWNYTQASGQKWFPVSVPFGNTPIVQVAFRTDEQGASRLYVFTAGRGIWSVPVQAQRFFDVSPSHWAYQAIEALGAAGITSGCAEYPTVYCPEGPVARDQMAVFLLRVLHGSNYKPPLATGVFTDVPTDYWAAAWVEQLRVEGITSGCATEPLSYCPSRNVSRAEMAVFLLRAKHGASYTPPAATGEFADVPASHWAAPWVEQLAREGVTSGCSVEVKAYCPDSTVDRAQMAVFITRAFQL